jgi:hypothetical protein
MGVRVKLPKGPCIIPGVPLSVCEQLQRMRTGNCDHSVGNGSNSRVHDD